MATIVTRAGKGSPLTHEEVDANFTNLNDEAATKAPLANPVFTGDVAIADKIVHSGDTNTAIRFPAADTVTVETSGAERLRVTSAGNVGIGTSSPYTKLDIVQATAGYGGWKYGASLNATDFPALRFLATTGNTGSIIAHEAGATVFLTGTTATGAGTERMRIDASGNLGLGVTPSAWNSAFKAIEIGRVGDALFSGSGGGPVISANGYYASDQWRYGRTGPAANYDLGTGTHKWFTAPSGTAGNAITFTQAMTLDASGNLGVGVTAPGQRLHIQGSAFSNTVARISTGGSTVGNFKRLEFTDNAGALSTGSITSFGSAQGAGNDYAMAFATAGTERARIASNGNVGIGTSSPATKLDVNGTANATTLSIGGTAITATATELNYVDGVTSNIQTQINALSGGGGGGFEQTFMLMGG